MKTVIAWLAMPQGGGLAPIFGALVGSNPGAGMALLLVVSGLLIGLTGLSGYWVPVVREVEDLLLDHDLVLKEM